MAGAPFILEIVLVLDGLVVLTAFVGVWIHVLAGVVHLVLILV